MDAHDTVTAEDLEALSPDERARLLNESVVTDLSLLPPTVLARIHKRSREILKARGLA